MSKPAQVTSIQVARERKLHAAARRYADARANWMAYDHPERNPDPEGDRLAEESWAAEKHLLLCAMSFGQVKS